MDSDTPSGQVHVYLAPDLDAAIEALRREQQRLDREKVSRSAIVRRLLRTHPRVEAWIADHTHERRDDDALEPGVF